jgi:hypothetical protein
MTRTRLLRRPTALRQLGALGLVAAGGLAFSAAPAFAAGETITLTQTDPTAVVGHAVNFTASGVLNPPDTWFGFDVFIYVKDADVDPTCAADEQTEGANSVGMGNYETSFAQACKITFAAPGHVALCGYVTDGMGGTLAATQLNVLSTAAATTTTTPTTPTTPTTTPTTATAAKPTVLIPNPVRAPWVTLSRHVLTCHAGTWLNKPTRYGYAWYVKGSNKKLASSSTLKVKASLRGRQVICKVTGSNATGSTTIPSKPLHAR